MAFDLTKVSWGGSSDSTGGTKTSPTSSSTTSIYRQGHEIYFTAVVNQNSIGSLIKLFHEIIVEERKETKGHYEIIPSVPAVDISLFLDTPGGCLSPCFKFIDFVESLRHRRILRTLTTIITGCVASAGTLMAIIGNKRYITTNAIAMVHELSGGSYGEFHQIVSRLKVITSIHNTVIRIMVSNTKLDSKTISELLLKETWFFGEEYLKAGFVDGIYQHAEEPSLSSSSSTPTPLPLHDAGN